MVCVSHSLQDTDTDVGGVYRPTMLNREERQSAGS